MRILSGIAVAATAIVVTPVGAQRAPTIMILPTYMKPSAKCYDPSLPQKPKLLNDRLSRAETAIQRYLAVASTGGDVSQLFIEKQKGILRIDGGQKPVAGFHDPWSTQVARLERIGFVVSNLSDYQYRAAWRAVASDGGTLGYYDVEFQRPGSSKRSIVSMSLVSPSQEPPKVTRYCKIQGDIENPSLRF